MDLGPEGAGVVQAGLEEEAGAADLAGGWRGWGGRYCQLEERREKPPSTEGLSSWGIRAKYDSPVRGKNPPVLFILFFGLFRATPSAYGGSQARG